MNSFEFDVEIAARAEFVSAAFWELADWPAIAPHVLSIDMLYSDENVQVLIMHVATRGRVDSFKSVRIRRGDVIFYYQPKPPAILRAHEGSWKLKRSELGTVVTSQHMIDVDTDVSQSFLREVGIETASPEGTRLQIQELIRNNSLQTILALKKRVEQTKVDPHAL